jgi:hypothetical protein
MNTPSRSRISMRDLEMADLKLSHQPFILRLYNVGQQHCRPTVGQFLDIAPTS